MKIKILKLILKIKISLDNTRGIPRYKKHVMPLNSGSISKSENLPPKITYNLPNMQLFASLKKILHLTYHFYNNFNLNWPEV